MCYLCVSAARQTGEFAGHIQSASTQPTSGVSVAAFSGSLYYTDALIEGFSWTGAKGQTAVVTYSFGYSTEGGDLFNGTLQAGALAAMQAWANVANITFQSNPFGDLTFSTDFLGVTTLGLTSTYFSGDEILSSEVQVNDTGAASVTNPTLGTTDYLVMLHELGHAIGLKHPGNYDGSSSGPFLPTAEDSIKNSVMSYNDTALVDQDSNPPSSPMIYDIAAIQEIYGANHNFQSGNTTWNYDGSERTMTIWDGAGTDTISASAYTGGGVTIDLREGINNVTRIGQAVVLVAFGANIESAVATINNDTLSGNALANQLTGGNGGDSITGATGADTMYGGDGAADPDDGNDTIAGEDGADLIYGNSGNDSLYGGVGIADAESSSDTIYGGFGIDGIYGNNGNDSLYGGGAGSDPSDLGDTIAGGNGADNIYANGGNDFIYGGGGAADPNEGSDLIFGGLGNDTIYANGGNDTLYGQNDNDSLHGGLGNDIYIFYGNDGDDVILFFEGAGTAGGDVIQLTANLNGSGISSAAQAAAAITLGSNGEGLLDLGGGHVLTILGVGTTLTADDFSIV